jgi:ferric-dicitrate binding protein FerR (iron transport regulator)
LALSREKNYPETGREMNLKDNREKNRLADFLNGKSSGNEANEIIDMLAAGEENTLLRKILEDDWNSFPDSSISSGDRLSALLDKIHHRISLKEHGKTRSLTERVTTYYSRIAAVILIPILAGAGFLLLRDRTGDTGLTPLTSIYAPAGSRVSFTLPDGTEGMLNSGSTLTYELPFTRDRAVALKGEAWFEVSQDEKHPFTVDAGDIDLTVLGTRFNVSAYPEEDYVEVVLESGKVQVKSDNYAEAMIMSPSEKLVYENGRVTRSTADPSKYSSWTNGKLVFRSDSMSEVARRIERWYNVKVEIMDDDLEKYSFRATFEDDPLEEVLKFLSMTSPIRYEITPRYLAEDSTYTRSVVKIYLK